MTNKINHGAAEEWGAIQILSMSTEMNFQEYDIILLAAALGAIGHASALGDTANSAINGAIIKIGTTIDATVSRRACR
jgi:hypothetical protein